MDMKTVKSWMKNQITNFTGPSRKFDTDLTHPNSGNSIRFGMQASVTVSLKIEYLIL